MGNTAVDYFPDKIQEKRHLNMKHEDEKRYSK